MVINQRLSFVFLIVISFVSEWPKYAWSQSLQESTIPFRSMGSKCWNNLGKCDDICDGETTRKIDYTCKELNTCCVPKKIVIPVNSIEKQTEQAGGQQSCALNNGKCHVKCMAPLTIYQGSVNECPLRYFCCITNKSKGGSTPAKSDSGEPPSDSDETPSSSEKPPSSSEDSEEADGIAYYGKGSSTTKKP